MNELPTEASGFRWRSWAERTLWTALFLVILRSVILWAMEHLAHGRDFELVRVSLAEMLPGIMLRAALYSLMAAALSVLAARWPRAARKRIFMRCLLLLASSFLFLFFLAGWDSMDITQQVALGTSRGISANAGIAAVSCFLARWLMRAGARSDPSAKGLAILRLALPSALIVIRTTNHIWM